MIMKNPLPPELAELQDPTPEQTQQILQISPATYWRMCKEGLLETYTVGKRGRRTRRESIQRLREQTAA